MPLVAIGTVALLAMAAFAIDIGYMYATRAKLQATADASSIAAVAELPSISDAQATGVQYGDLNYPSAGTAVAGADVIPGSWDEGSDSFSAWVAPYDAVRVTARRAAANGNALDLFFAPILGRDTADVVAAAVAVKGHPRKLAVLPIIFSECEWIRFQPTIQEGPPFSGSPVLIYFHGSAEPCHGSPSGQDLPGGFGWLNTTLPCEAEVEIGGWVGIDPGASPPSDCDAAYMASLIGTVVLVPWFNDISGVGNNAQYRVGDFSALYLTGYNFGGQYKEPGKQATPCKGDDRCIEGYFTTAVLPDGDIGGEDRGVTIVKLVQ